MKKLTLEHPLMVNWILKQPVKENYYYTTLNSGLLIFIGAKKTFKIIKEGFLDLKVGDRICRIGKSGKGQAVLNREDEFRPYVTYVGYRMEKIHSLSIKENKILLFQTREEDKPESVEADDNFYIAYIVLEDERTDEIVYELKTPATPDGRQAIRIFKPIFERFNDL